MSNFGRELKAQRALAGISQRQAAEAIPFLSVRTLQCWEHGHQSPPVWAQNLILEKLSKTKRRPKRQNDPDQLSGDSNQKPK